MRTALIALCLFSLLAASPSTAVETTPPSTGAGPSPGAAPRPTGSAAAGVTAIVVRSWGSESVALVWEYLNTHWPSYGTTPVFIDYSSLHSVSSFTLADLENSGADVVIVSDAAGAVLQWSAAEVAALASYADQGHPLVGTYVLFQWGPADDRMLAPLWGLRSYLEYNSTFPFPIPAAASADILAPSSCLFSRIAGPLDQGGYPYIQAPLDGSWDASDLAGASFVARSPDGRNVVSAYSSGNRYATYISYMPEYQDGSQFDAVQYLYNAIVCRFAITPTLKSSWGRLKAAYR